MSFDVDGLVRDVKEKGELNSRDWLLGWGRKNNVFVVKYGDISGSKGLKVCERVIKELKSKGLWGEISIEEVRKFKEESMDK